MGGYPFRIGAGTAGRGDDHGERPQQRQEQQQCPVAGYLLGHHLGHHGERRHQLLAAGTVQGELVDQHAGKHADRERGIHFLGDKGQNQCQNRRHDGPQPGRNELESFHDSPSVRAFPRNPWALQTLDGPSIPKLVKFSAGTPPANVRNGPKRAVRPRHDGRRNAVHLARGPSQSCAPSRPRPQTPGCRPKERHPRGRVRNRIVRPSGYFAARNLPAQ